MRKLETSLGSTDLAKWRKNANRSFVSYLAALYQQNRALRLELNVKVIMHGEVKSTDEGSVIDSLVKLRNPQRPSSQNNGTAAENQYTNFQMGCNLKLTC